MLHNKETREERKQRYYTNKHENKHIHNKIREKYDNYSLYFHH